MNRITKIKDLIAALQACDPDGCVAISLDAALLYDDDECGDIEYDFEPVVDFLFCRTDAVRSDRVHFRLPEAETVRIVETRRSQVTTDLRPPANSQPANHGIVAGAPIAVAIGLNNDVYVNLLAVVDHCNRADDDNNGATTHGKLMSPS